MKHHWGSGLVHPTDKDLPGLKFKYVEEWIRYKHGNLLELGCGSCKILRSIRYYNSDITLYGVDINCPELINTPTIDNTSLFVEDGTKTHFQDGLFDFILVADYLEHVNDIDVALKEIYRILKVDGEVNCFIPIEGERFSAYSLSRLLLGKDVFLKTKDHAKAYTKKEIKNVLEKYFDIIDIKYSYHLMGHIMDAALFTLTLNKSIAKLFWNENKYYNEKPKKGIISKTFNTMMSAANYIAYIESRLLRNFTVGASGVHIILRKKVGISGR